MSTTAQFPRAEHYEAAARTALRQAVAFRNDALARCSPWDRRIDRAVMRAFAMEWRDYRRLAIRFGAA